MPELVYGRHPVVEAIRAGWGIRQVLVAEGSRFPQGVLEALRKAERRGVPVVSVSRRKLDELATHHQGIVAEAEPFPYTPLATIVEKLPKSPRPPLLVMLDALQDPQNFGTLIRTAAAVGAQGVVIPERRAVGVTPAVVKASAGTVFLVPVARVTNLTRAAKELKNAGLWIVGLDAGAAVAYDQVDLTGPTAVVVGSEGEGIHRLLRQECDFLVRLPMEPGVESLNAAVAGSIVLYEAYSQRRKKLARVAASSTGQEDDSKGH